MKRLALVLLSACLLSGCEHYHVVATIATNDAGCIYVQDNWNGKIYCVVGINIVGEVPLP